MCGWFRQVAARGREGGLGPGACLLPSHMQQDVTGLRKGPQGHPWPEKPLSCGKAAPRPLVGRV